MPQPEEFGPVAIHTGSQCLIRPLAAADLAGTVDEGADIDPRWCALRWVGGGEPAGEFDCVAWLDAGRLFIPADGQSLLGEFVPDGVPNVGSFWNYRRVNGWYDAETGRLAIPRTSMPLWYQKTGPVARGPIPTLPR